MKSFSMTNQISSNANQPDLFSPIRLGDLELKNRMVMAPMTRSRAGEGNVPSELAVTYYVQRASAGLIISEATQVSRQGVGYINTPGLHTNDQITGWRRITEGVHAAGGKIFAQLWHVGRVSHPDFHNGELPVAPSAIGFVGESYTPQGKKNVVAPRALGQFEIKEIIAAFRQAAVNARLAGFDGVEIHGANGYLPDQFLQDGSNLRTDAYGGSAEKRARFLIEVTEAAISVWGADRVGVRLSPRNPYNGMYDSDPDNTFGVAIAALNWLGVAYLHLVGDPDGRFADLFKGIVISNGGHTFASGTKLVASKSADMVSYASLFLANPDLPERFLSGAPLNIPDAATFYGGDHRGYIDYPFLASGK